MIVLKVGRADENVIVFTDIMGENIFMLDDQEMKIIVDSLDEVLT